MSFSPSKLVVFMSNAIIHRTVSRVRWCWLMLQLYILHNRYQDNKAQNKAKASVEITMRNERLENNAIIFVQIMAQPQVQQKT